VPRVGILDTARLLSMAAVWKLNYDKYIEKLKQKIIKGKS